jgi:aerobic-type carbon monoxide dehydrogenase small subunit (CoxS/CutS family)
MLCMCIGSMHGVMLGSLLQSNPTPTQQEIENLFDGNICRCTGTHVCCMCTACVLHVCYMCAACVLHA